MQDACKTTGERVSAPLVSAQLLSQDVKKEKSAGRPALRTAGKIGQLRA